MPAAAADPASVVGSVVIDGTTATFGHGRAWKNGAVLGIPKVQIVLAERALTDLDWWSMASELEAGKRGRALVIEPDLAAGNDPARPPYR